MTVVYALDKNFGQYLPTVLNALWLHNPDAKAHVFIEGGQVTNVIHPNLIVHNLNVFEGKIKPESPQYNYYLHFSTFARLWFSEVLEEDKVLWMDMDTLIDQPLDQLWNINMDDYYVAGVMDKHYDMLYKINPAYINAGVLLMNLKKWRKDGLSQLATELVNKNKYQYGDQDIINYMCRGHIKHLNGTYNYGRCTCIEGASEPVHIYHWASSPKAWESKDSHDRELWYKYHMSYYEYIGE